VAVRIVTDSVADIPGDLARELGIAVVPLVLRFGEVSSRDGLDIDNDGFYAKLASSTEFPVSSAPAPADFARVFDEAVAAGDGVLAITLSAKLSGTHAAALQGRSLAVDPGRVVVMDSGQAAIAEGFVAMAAARAARDGGSIEEAAAAARAVAARVRLVAAFDTLEYLRRGGRIGAAASLLGSLLRINPLIALRDGLVHPAGRTRSRAKAIDELEAFARSHARIDELAVSDGACPDEAAALADRLADLLPGRRILRTRMTPVIGCHTGPGLLVVTVVGDAG
jgi:DegV family protein with EDD domain